MYCIYSGVIKMDRRTPLKSGHVLALGGESYTLERLVGFGSNAFVYLAAYQDNLERDKAHTVYIKELFPYHPNGEVSRDVTGALVHTQKAEAFFELHKKSFLRGNACHLEMQSIRADLTGGNFNTYEKNGTLYTILGNSNGETLQDAIKKDATLHTLPGIISCLLGVLDALEVFHNNGFLHLDISPDNILLLPPATDGGDRRRAFLIDYNSAWNLSLLAENEAYFSIKEHYSAPELRLRDKKAIAPATDLFSICAIFFECLTGHALDFSDVYKGELRVDANAKLLAGVCATAVEKAVAIMRKGLKLPPKQRYQSVQSLRNDLNELNRRIAGVGITHAALWEASRSGFRTRIGEDARYKYISTEGELFSCNVKTENGEIVPIYEALHQTGNSHIELTGSGGMGKTTALLMLWKEGTAAYSASRPVPVYVPLYRYKAGVIPFIKGCLLERLKFDESTAKVEDALRALDRLLDTPVCGEPSVLLLLDGLNETTWDAQGLLSEVDELAAKKGVKIVLTSRYKSTLPCLTHVEIQPLSEEEIEHYLLRRNVLCPSDATLRALITNPMMLCMYASVSGAAEKPVSIGSANELAGLFTDNLLRTYQNMVVEDDAEQYRAEYAVHFLLPEIVFHMGRYKKNFLTPNEVYAPVKRCFALLTKKRFRRAYTKYIGKSKLIKGNSSTAEEWFHGMLDTLLCKKLALVSCDEGDGFRLAHQNYFDHFMSEYNLRQKKLRAAGIRMAFPYAILCGALAVLLALNAGKLAGYLPLAYPRTTQERTSTENAMTALADSLSRLGMQLQNDAAMLDAAKKGYAAFITAQERFCSRNDALVQTPYTESEIELYTPHNSPIPTELLCMLLNSPNTYGAFSKSMMDNLEAVLSYESIYPEKDRLEVISLYEQYLESYADGCYLSLQRVLVPLSDEARKPVYDALPYIAVFGGLFASKPPNQDEYTLKTALESEGVRLEEIKNALAGYGLPEKENVP